MNFQIPQFIEVENKIVGPLTIKQFLYLAGAGGFSFMIFFILQTWLWLMITAVLGGAAVSLAFIKYNGQPLERIALSAFGFFWKPRFYLWQRMPKQKIISIPSISIEEKRKKLSDYLSGVPGVVPSVKKLWQAMMTTKAPIAKREKGISTTYWGKKPQERYQLFRKISGDKSIARRIDYR